MSVKTYKEYAYDRITVSSGDVIDTITETLGLDVGDVRDIIYDGKVLPVVVLNNKIWSMLRSILVAAATIDFPITYIAKYSDDTDGFFHGCLNIVLERAADVIIRFVDGAVVTYVKTAANTDTNFNILVSKWRDDEPRLEVENLDAVNPLNYTLGIYGVMDARSALPW